MRTDRLIRVTKAHAEEVYQITLDKLQREREAHARKTTKGGLNVRNRM